MNVDVYFNLHRKLFSLKSLKTGLVLSHWGRVVLTDATFRVQKGGRARVLAEGKKNVHAFVRGTIASTGDPGTSSLVANRKGGGWRTATYNPYQHETFVDTVTNLPVTEAKVVVLDVEEGKGRIYYKPEGSPT